MMLYKSSKAFLAFFALAILCLFTFVKPAELSAQYDCANMVYSTIDTISCESSGGLTKTLPGHGPFYTCDITVIYNIKKCLVVDANCPGNQREVLSLTITGFHWGWDTSPSEGCFFLNFFLNPGNPGWPVDFSFSPDRFRTFWHEFIPYFSDLLFMDYYIDEEEPYSLQCGGTYPSCQEPDKDYCPQMLINVTMPKCQDLCVNKDIYTGDFIFAFVDCITSETACCVWKNYYCACVDRSGVLQDYRVVRETEPIVYPPETEEGCGGDPNEPLDCPLGPWEPVDHLPCFQHCGTQP